MTVKEYNKLYAEVGTCKCVVSHLDEILKDGDIKRLQSLVPDNFVQLIDEALDMYLVHSRLQINPNLRSVKMKYYVSAKTDRGFVGCILSVERQLNSVEGIKAVMEHLEREGHHNPVILFFSKIK